MKLRFEKKPDPENRFDNTYLSLETEQVSLPEILKDFQDFLKGCGFTFNGDIVIIDEAADTSTDFPSPNKQSQEFDF